MKKITIAAMSMCVAVMSQAASVDWQYTDNSESGDQVGYTVYAIAGAIQDNWKSAAEIKSAAMAGGVATIEDQGRAGYGTDLMTAASDSLTKEGGYFLVVVNASEDKFGIIEGNANMIYDPSKQESSTGAYQVADVATTSSFSGEPGPIPEPTSGLLMLLGVAGLALRRKQQ